MQKIDFPTEYIALLYVVLNNCSKKMNTCPFNLDIELWQFICNEMNFKDQNYFLSCDRNLWYQLRIFVLPQKYGGLMNDKIIINDDRYYYFRKVNFVVNIWTFNWKITDEGLKYLTNVTSINLYCCSKITNEGLKYLTNVTSINLYCCSKITNEGLKYLTNVTSINLRECKKITDEALKYLTNATTINLEGCEKITDEGLKYLTNATTINLEGCEKITDEGLKYLTNATTIYLRGCHKITKEGLKYLSRATTIISDCNTLLLNSIGFICMMTNYHNCNKLTN